MNRRDTIYQAKRNTINALLWLQDISEYSRVDLQGLVDVIAEMEHTAKELRALFNIHNKERTPVPSLDKLKAEIAEIKGGK